MKRCSADTRMYVPRQRDCHKTERAMRDMSLEEKNHVRHIGYGKIQHTDKSFVWIKTLDVVGCKVAKERNRDPDVELVEGDFVKLVYTNQELQLGRVELNVLEFCPLSEICVGRVTQVMHDGLLINGNAKLTFSAATTTTSYQGLVVNSLVDFGAVRHDSGHIVYRCLWAKLVEEGDERLSLVRPNLDVLPQIAKAGQNTGGIFVPAEGLSFLFRALLETQEDSVKLTNLGKSERMLVALSVEGDPGTLEGQFTVLQPDLSMGRIKIGAHSSVEVRIRAECKQLGNSSACLVLHFDGDVTQWRRLSIVAGDEQFLAEYSGGHAGSFAPSTRREQMFANMHLQWAGPRQLGGARPAPVRRGLKCREWLVNPQITQLLRLDVKDWNAVLDSQYEYLQGPLTAKNYTCKWHDLLWLEETALFHSMQVHNGRNVRLVKEPEEHLYSVSGSYAEGRPSILPGDRFQATSPRQKFDGLVVRVTHDKALIRMVPEFSGGPDQRAWSTTFKFARFAYRMEHEVVERREKQVANDAWLFPSRDHLTRQPPQLDVRNPTPGQLVVYGRQAEQPEGDEEVEVKELQPLDLLRPDLNAQQKEAVRNVLRGEYRSCPYLISGPPGTGKTTVLVEILFQVWTLLPRSAILVVTQSNSAADVILHKLVDSGRVRPGDLLRIVGKQQYKQQEGIAEHLRPYCTALEEVDEEEEKEEEDGKREGKRPRVQASVDLATLMATRLLITTCGTVKYLRRMDYPADHLTHLVVDEASQCMEPTTLVAISLMENAHSQLVMAGDVKQLGPVLTWDALADCGYNVSLFERLLRVPGLYLEDAKWQEEHPTLWPVVEEVYSALVDNYRSVPNILTLFSDLFYGGRLRSRLVAPQMHEMVLHTTALSMPASPHRSVDQGVFFLSVVGENKRRPGDPSWFNPSEAAVVLETLKKLQGLGINLENDVVVMSPYQGQVRYLRTQLANHGVDRCRVRSVEEFQGQECAIVILSTVRSLTSLVSVDQKFDLGFVNNPRRTNVALSRAQCLLVVVGNAPVLCKDPLWARIIEYCAHRYAYFDMHSQLLESIL